MPCYTITTVKLTLKNAELDILKKTLEDRGYRVTKQDDSLYWSGGSYSKKTGEITSRSNMEWIKSAYTKELVTQKCKRYGWCIKGETDGKITLYKR